MKTLIYLLTAELFISTVAISALHAQALPECDPSKSANSSCMITINRESPSSPLPISMGSSAATVRATKRPLEQVQFNASSTQAPPPDPLAAIVNAFSPSLKPVTLSVVTAGGQKISTPAEPQFFSLNLDGNPAPSKPTLESVKSEIAWINSQQQGLKSLLDGLKKALDDAAGDIKALQGMPAGSWTPGDFRDQKKKLVCEIAAGGNASPNGVDQNYQCGVPQPGVGLRIPPVGVVAGLHEAVATATKDFGSLAQSLPTQAALLKSAADAKQAFDKAQAEADAADDVANKAKADSDTAQATARSSPANAAAQADAAAKAAIAQIRIGEAAAKDSVALNAKQDALDTATRALGSSQADLKDVEDALNAVGSNQAQLDASVKTVTDAQSAIMSFASTLQGINTANVALVDEKSYAASMQAGSRTTVVAVSVKDLVTGTVTDLSTKVTIVWGVSTRWEVSTGAAFSTLANRSFSAAPIIANGQPQTDSSGKTVSQVVQTIARPEVIPFALAHYRVGETSVGGRSAAFLIAGGIGVNPYSALADFGAGVTLRYGQFMISPLVHFGHDVRLVNGVSTGESLGSSPPPLPTERYWVKKLAVAITIRIPIK